ncbi:tRNA-dihydrouridine synthase B [uncultured archaeon]|nr:tRNA-dihydrouridine synthase B [uncultured archaeon]
MIHLKIGKIALDGALVLAPMSDVTNLPFRLLCKKHGASLVYSEMVCSGGIVRQNVESMDRCLTSEDERPFGIQLLGSDAFDLVNSAQILQERYNPDLFDINLGCPAQSVVKNGFGSALLKSPEIIGEIIEQLSSALDIPLTAKIRIINSFDETLKIAKVIEKAGAAAITVHGRTQKQGYSGKSSLEFIKGIKKELSIPVIANGDIYDEKTAREALEYTRCDGLMIGRAAIGNPYIFKRLSHYLSTGELLPPQAMDERLRDFYDYTALCQKFDMLGLNDLKLNAQYFTKGMENIKSVRIEINKANDIDSVMGIMMDLKL